MLTIGSLCTGYGGLETAITSVLDCHVSWVADPDPGATAVLAHHHPDIPNLGDITTADWGQVPPVDILAAGYPCTPFSLSGHRGGTNDERHLWPHVAQAIRRLRPRLVVLENVAGHRSLGFGRVLGDLADLGFDAEWESVYASDIDATHGRERVFVAAWPSEAVADREDQRHEWGRVPRHRGPGSPDRDLAPIHSDPRWGQYRPAIDAWARHLGRPAPHPTRPAEGSEDQLTPEFLEWFMGLPEGWVTAVPRLTRRQKIRLLGNGVVPQQGAYALRLLLDRVPPLFAAADPNVLPGQLDVLSAVTL